MRVVVAPDKFKGSLTAAAVAEAVADGIHDLRPEVTTTLAPVADGGDGTVAAAVAAGYREVPVTVDGPTGEPVDASYAVRGSRAVVDLAAACGIDLLPGGRLCPLTASTFGLGQVIGHAVDQGAREIIVGLGGSASTDGGAGMLTALGARLLTADGPLAERGGAALSQATALDLTALRTRVAGVRFVVAGDVDNPLLGSRGAAAVFGPQKGADPDQVRQLDSALATFAAAVGAALGADGNVSDGTDFASQPGAGAAGGTGFAALAVLGAELQQGIRLVLDLLDFDATLTGADLVVTGEGSLDEQSLAGKAPVGVADAAARAGVPVVAVAGRNTLPTARLAAAGITAVYPLSELEPDVSNSINNAAQLLREVGRQIAKEWL